MKSPCELVIWYVLPSVRSELAKEMVKLGLSQKEVANKLGISEAAISHYVKGKRGKKIILDREARNEIKKLAKGLSTSDANSCLIPKICEICIKVRKSRVLCKLHRSLEPVPAGCNICLELLK